MTITAKFEVGKVYTGRFITDADSVFAFEVVKRTDKSVWIKRAGADNAAPKMKRIKVWDGIEQCEPYGQYSMSPALYANKVRAEKTADVA